MRGREREGGGATRVEEGGTVPPEWWGGGVRGYSVVMGSMILDHDIGRKSVAKKSRNEKRQRAQTDAASFQFVGGGVDRRRESGR